MTNAIHTPGMKPDPSHDFEVLLHAVPAALLVVDFAGRIVHANRRALYDFAYLETADMCKLTLPDVVSGADGELLDHLTSRLETARSETIQATCTVIDGSTFPAELRVSRLALERNYLLFLILDIRLQVSLNETIKALHDKYDKKKEG